MEASFLKANHLLLVASPPVSSAIHCIVPSLSAPYKPAEVYLAWESEALFSFPLMYEGIYLFSFLIQYLERVLTFTIFISPFIHYSNYHNPDFNNYISLPMRPINRVGENNSFRQILLRACLLPAKSLSIRSRECLIWHRIQQIPSLQCLWFLPGFLYSICISYVISLQTSFF